MKKIAALLLSLLMVLTGCSFSETAQTVQSSSEASSAPLSSEDSETPRVKQLDIAIDPSSEEYVDSLGFESLSDPSLLRYMEDTIYSDLVAQSDMEGRFIENVSAIYVSREYIDELSYNSMENVYFGYSSSELFDQFQDTRYLFTVGDNGETVVKEYEKYDETYDDFVKNIAIGTGVILVCVTVAAVAEAAGVPAVSVIFSASAESAATAALSSGLISGISAGIVEGVETNDFEKALKAAAAEGGNRFKWGAVSGALKGGKSAVTDLVGASMNGLSVEEAANVQKNSSYPLDVIKELKNTEQFKVCKEAGLTPEMVGGKTALIRDIDLDRVDEESGLTNLERMKKGLAALDPNGHSYELHHIGQHADSTLAILTREEHRMGDNFSIWHELGKESEIDRKEFDKIRSDFWKETAELLAA